MNGTAVAVYDDCGEIHGKLPNRLKWFSDDWHSRDDLWCDIDGIIFGDFLVATYDDGSIDSLSEEDIEKYKEYFKYPEICIKEEGKYRMLRLRCLGIEIPGEPI